jgi:hypothetical protein
MNYVLAHLWAVPGETPDTGAMIAIMGQEVYATGPEAQAAATTELTSLRIDRLPFQEFVPIATLIFQTATIYSNAVAARTLTTDEGGDYVDWRSGTIAGASGGGGAVSWGNITGTLSDQTDLQNALDAADAPWLEDAFTPTAGQVTFILSQAPTDAASLSLHVNGIEAIETDDYTVSGTTLTWLNSIFSMETDDAVVIKYK